MRPGIGIDLGGTRIKALAYDLDNDRELETRLPPTRDGETIEGSPAWASAIRELIANWESEWGCRAEVIGISAPGLAARDGSGITHMPGKLEGIECFPWTEYLGREKKVIVLNDAHAALIGEVWKGAARDMKDVILLTLGTGVGGAALVDGKLLTGHIGRGGHFGHISLDAEGELNPMNCPGSLENAIGECTIKKRCNQKFQSTRELVEAHLAGNADATKVLNQSLRGLAAGITSLINILDPEAVILSGGITQGGSAILAPVEARLEEIEWRPGGHKVKLLIAENQDWAGAYGALHRAIDMNKTSSLQAS